MRLGIDVSNNNGHINWPLVGRTGVTLAMVKVSEGIDFIDDFALANIDGALQAGMMVGVYHYWRPSMYSAELESEHFQNVLSQLPSVTLVAIDAEDPEVIDGENLAVRCGRMLSYTEANTGHTPRLYSSRGYINDHGLARIDNAARYPLWLASWSSTEPISPAPWGRVNGWQFAAGVTWPGISSVDLSIWDY